MSRSITARNPQPDRPLPAADRGGYVGLYRNDPISIGQVSSEIVTRLEMAVEDEAARVAVESGSNRGDL